ncbi:DUF551 domain-containing protein [Klebsiella pneumoniae]|uniref:DUF551 domain-containing protein n=1 Tax=Klebsiella pneumoniae TaxID=573 RepID=UPI0003D8C6C4|nr:DUF551 domain-containing protein [Klebsiella pneumoniae]AHE43255.1 hypothetical protein KP13_00892 [Klebsiella pneumoniae subsp. pneumoniae Kp13]PHK68153.1 DUF551 domain-containing protein [Klebsiella pneumoniae subsp. pneumoniae]PVW48449.1 DUF551 domain-containing protein [Klebsiella pneumoniae]RCI24108.1 DUF551 domain-containing protein [Klebsiella pneumoniae]
MTSKLTREERVQALCYLKVGQVLSPSDIENVKMLSRMVLAAMDSEPVAWRYRYHNGLAQSNWKYVDSESECNSAPNYQVQSLYRHAQKPVAPDDVLDALQKVARIRLDLNDFDGDRRGIADCLCDAEEALIEVVNRRAATLAAAPQPQNAQQNIPEIIPGWIPVSERMPESNGVYFGWDGKRVLEVNCFFGGFSANQFIHGEITHWMPLPAPPTEVK